MIDSFFCQQTSSDCSECFFLFRGKYIIENSDVCQWLVLVSFIQNHSAITQLFYVTTSLSLKLLVHNLLCSEILQVELLLHQAEKSKNFCTLLWQLWLSQPPYLPTSSYATGQYLHWVATYIALVNSDTPASVCYGRTNLTGKLSQKN